MRPLQLLVPFIISISFGLAQDPGLSPPTETFPKCALSCLLTSIQDSPCELSDQKCICTNVELQGSIELCVRQSCTVRESLTAKNATQPICNVPMRYKGNTTRACSLVFSVLCPFIVFIRLLYKAILSATDLGWDDWAVLLLLCVSAPSVVIIDKYAIPYGIGSDVWTVPFDHITEFVRWLYVLGVLYFLQIALLKLSILLFLLRIFPRPLTKRLLKATIAFNLLYGGAFVITGIFQCQPISFYWTSWDKNPAIRGKCMNINALNWSNAVIGVVLDVWMLAIPLYEVFHLQLSLRKKISVVLMFFVGTFVTVISAVRLQSLVTFAASSNPTWNQADVITWSLVEIGVGIVCTCMPALRVILNRMFPKLLGMTTDRSQPYYANHPDPTNNSGRGGSTLGSGLNKQQNTNAGAAHDPNISKTSNVQHTDDDEVQLLELVELASKNRQSAEQKHE
ncbi:hypothetical protein BU23DRAFT_547903 [Bimuria novae-zelandiae CBS 107.79]|uniref:CFEM domain-containing protein n=1 Tax=Bimuria novae-zelandiae CBS 107.79 TaxID=1447943 RepID=A0A6A5UIG5_9PLEO|nr:hypothetical protein BU23DRAFT_547903 [Bimuria novae-zelandiae CBS 107.79]